MPTTHTGYLCLSVQKADLSPEPAAAAMSGTNVPCILIHYIFLWFDTI